MSKQWDMLDICAERTTAAGVKQVLVIWRPTWEPVDQVSTGAVWENWISEQKTFAAREKRVEDDVASAVDAGSAEVVTKRGRGRPPKMKVSAVLVEAAKAAVDGKTSDDVVDKVVDNDDRSSSDDDSSSDGGSSSDIDDDLKKTKFPNTATTVTEADASKVVGAGKKVVVVKRGKSRGRGRPRSKK